MEQESGNPADAEERREDRPGMFRSMISHMHTERGAGAARAGCRGLRLPVLRSLHLHCGKAAKSQVK